MFSVQSISYDLIFSLVYDGNIQISEKSDAFHSLHSNAN
jgi:hypothetical protein